MQQIAVALAVFSVLVLHYVFSFQRFTLGIARKQAQSISDVAQIQMLLTPTFMGALGWLGNFLALISGVLLGVAFYWWVGVVFVVAEFTITSLLPLLPLNGHYARMARQELQKQSMGPAAAFVPLLMNDIDDAERSKIS